LQNEDTRRRWVGGDASSPSQVNYSTMSFTRRRGQSDGQPRCTKQREKETEEKGSQGDVSTGEARDSLQANAASPDATCRTDKAVDSGGTGALLVFSDRFTAVFRGRRYAGDLGFVLDAADRLLMKGTAVK
jgi:hypothetical protein